VNNRDLTTFTLDLNTTVRCCALVPAGLDDVVVLALSGMKSREDVLPYEALPCLKGVLVGEALMRNANPAREIRRLVVPADAGEDAATAGSTRVKICGLVRPEDAVQACRSGASFLGLIFAEKSPRRTSVEQAREVVEAVNKFREGRTCALDLPEGKRSRVDAFAAGKAALERACARGPLLVGVFMDQDMDFVNLTSTQLGLDLVQLHGRETPADVARCVKPVLKVVHVPHAGCAALDVEETLRACEGAVGVLLDTTVTGQASGGTGVAFAWGLAKPLVDAGVAVFVAGGLTPDNARQAMREAGGPLALDCSSGVQGATPREKSPELIAKFCKSVLL
jgi:phosphoribosylanthranilate isomerase